MVERSAHNPQVKGLSPASDNWTEEVGKKSLLFGLCSVRFFHEVEARARAVFLNFY